MYNKRNITMYKNNNLKSSKLTLNNFPENLRDEVKNNYVGDKAALQAYELFKFVESYSFNSLKSETRYADEESQYDESGIYYGYFIDMIISKDKKWIVIKLLVSSYEKKTLFISNNVNDKKYKDIINGFKCPIDSCFGKYFKITVNNKDYGNGNIKSFVNKIEPLTACEKEIINHAGKFLFEQFNNEMEEE